MDKSEIGKSGDGFIDRSKVRILLCDNDEKSSEEVLTLLCKCSYQGTCYLIFFYFWIIVDILIEFVFILCQLISCLLSLQFFFAIVSMVYLNNKTDMKYYFLFTKWLYWYSFQQS